MKRMFIIAAAALSIVGVAHAEKFQDRFPNTVKEIPCTTQTVVDTSCFTIADASEMPSITPRVMLAQATTTKADSTTVTTSAPVSSTTVVKGGNLAAQILEWIQVAFGAAIGSGILAAIYKGLQLVGIKATDQMKGQLQALVINGLNDGFAKAKDAARGTSVLDIDVKNAATANAIDYVQRHGADTIKALGLDPKSGEAVEAIRARIETALNDPTTPTPADITPPTGLPQVNKVIVNGAHV